MSETIYVFFCYGKQFYLPFKLFCDKLLHVQLSSTELKINFSLFPPLRYLQYTLDENISQMNETSDLWRQKLWEQTFSSKFLLLFFLSFNRTSSYLKASVGFLLAQVEIQTFLESRSHNSRCLRSGYVNRIVAECVSYNFLLLLETENKLNSTNLIIIFHIYMFKLHMCISQFCVHFLCLNVWWSWRERSNFLYICIP